MSRTKLEVKNWNGTSEQLLAKLTKWNRCRKMYSSIRRKTGKQ